MNAQGWFPTLICDFESQAHEQFKTSFYNNLEKYVHPDGIDGEPLDLSKPLLAPQARKWARELTVIASNNDRWLPRGIQIYEEPLQTKPLVFENAGHFSLDDGWGPWAGLLHWIDSADDQDLLIR